MKQIGSDETVVGAKIKKKKETKDEEQSQEKTRKSPLGILPSKMSPWHIINETPNLVLIT